MYVQGHQLINQVECHSCINAKVLPVGLIFVGLSTFIVWIQIANSGFNGYVV